MATRHWVGGTSGDWDVADNWEEAAVPVDGDDVVLNIGDVSIDDGLDQSGVGLASLTVGPGYSGQVGTSRTNPLVIGAERVVINGGGARHFIEGDAVDNALEDVRVLAIGSSGLESLDVAGFCDFLLVRRGKVTLSDGTFGKVVLSATGGVDSNAALSVLDADITEFWKRWGTVELLAGGSGVITGAWVLSGTIIVNGGGITNLHLLSGNAVWNVAAGMTLAEVMSGKLDMTGDPNAKTVASLTVYERGVVDLQNGMSNITVTDLLNLYGTVLQETAV